MAQPAPDRDQVSPRSDFRIVHRTYTGNAAPLVEVLLMLYDWSLERELRARARVPTPPETGTDRQCP